MQYGFPSTIEALEEEQKDLLREAYATDPLWSCKVRYQRTQYNQIDRSPASCFMCTLVLF